MCIYIWLIYVNMYMYIVCFQVKLTGCPCILAMEITFGLAAGSGYLSATATAAAHTASAAAAVASAAPAASASAAAAASATSGAAFLSMAALALPASALAAVGVAGAMALFWMPQAAPQAQKHCRANTAKNFQHLAN